MIRLKSIKIKALYNIIFVNDIEKIRRICSGYNYGAYGELARIDFEVYYIDRPTVYFSVKPNSIAHKSICCVRSFFMKDYDRISEMLKDYEAKYKLKIERNERQIK